jgi:aspartate aminotransferase
VRDLAVEHDFAVVSDEIYKEITYDGVEPTSMGAFEGMAGRTITLNGFSKAYAMTGWRLGYYAAPEAVVEQSGKIHGHSVTCAVNFVQHAGIEALENTDEAVEEMRAAFEARRDMLVERFADHGKDVPTPAGAFYLMVSVWDDDVAWAEEAIDEAHVATVPGSAFGTPGWVRLAYANSEDRLREGVERLADHDLL